MARYLTAGVVVLADDHPHSQGTIETARAYAGHRYAVGHDGASLSDFDEVVDPGGDQLTVAVAFKEAARRRIPWVALRRDLAPPAELLAQLLQAAARRTSKDLPGFAVLLTGPERRTIRRILAIVDRSDGPPSGLLTLAAVAAAEQTGAAVDVLVIGAPNEELDSSARRDEILRVARDRDLFEQAKRRSASLGAQGNWMFIDHVESRVELVRDVLAAHEYDLIVDDLGDVNLGGRMGRGKRIDKALRKGGPASITMAVLKKTDLPVLLVLDAVRLGLIPARVKVGAGASVLALGIMVSAAPKAAASPTQRSRAQTSISQTVDDYDAALTAAANLGTSAQVQQTHEQAIASGDEAAAAITGDDSEAPDATEAAQATDEAQQTDDQATDEAQQSDQASDEARQGDEQAASQEAEDQDTQAAEATDDSPDPTQVAPGELSPESVTPQEAPSVDPDDISVPDDVSHDDVDQADQAADESKEALDAAQEDFDEAQQAAIDAQAAAEDASAAAVKASSDLDRAHANYEQVSAAADDVIADATGITGALPGGASADDMADAQAQEADAFAELEQAGQQADQTLQDYQEAATAAGEASTELDAAATAVTEAQAQYNQDKATAEATEDAYHEEMANARVSPVAEGEYTPTGHYGDAGPYWSTGYHTGEDYAAPIGTDVVAAGSGTVVEVKHDDPSYGNRIVIEHEDGYYTTYNHLSQVDVSVGQEVTAGDKIGEVGDTGNVTGPHLHFEVTQGGDGWSSGSFVDPHSWLSGEVG